MHARENLSIIFWCLLGVAAYSGTTSSILPPATKGKPFVLVFLATFFYIALGYMAAAGYNMMFENEKQAGIMFLLIYWGSCAVGIILAMFLSKFLPL